MFTHYHKIEAALERDQKTRKYKRGVLTYSRTEFNYLQNLMWHCSEKIDGTNIRVMYDGDKVHFGGRTDNAQIPSGLLSVLQDLFTPEKMEDVRGLTLFGEGFGGSIQKVGKDYGDFQFALFDVYSKGVWLERHNVHDIASKLCIQSVHEEKKSLIQAIADVSTMNQYPAASKFGNAKIEGYVCRPEVELFDRLGKRIITKIRVADF